jgi:hypothetical protein
LEVGFLEDGFLGTLGLEVSFCGVILGSCFFSVAFRVAILGSWFYGVILGSWFLRGDFRQLFFLMGFFQSSFVFIYLKALTHVFMALW